MEFQLQSVYFIIYTSLMIYTNLAYPKETCCYDLKLGSDYNLGKDLRR